MLLDNTASLGCSTRICLAGGLALGGLLDRHTGLLDRWVARFVGYLWEAFGPSLGTLFLGIPMYPIAAQAYV